MKERLFSLLLKSSLLMMLLGVIGFPINHLWQLGTLIAALFFIVVCAYHSNPYRWVGAFCLACVLILIKLSFPQVTIQEGHNVFLVTDKNQIFEQTLPPEVFDVMISELHWAYPKEKRCDARAPGCWVSSSPSSQLYAFSADGIWQKAKYSRAVEEINFNDINQLRVGTINEIDYNFYDKTSDLKRAHLPVFVMYEFPSSLQGSSLCWQGLLLQKNLQGNFQKVFHQDFSCQLLRENNLQVYGVRINPDHPLRMTLELPFSLKLTSLLKKFLCIIGTLSILLFVLKFPSWSTISFPIFSILSSFFVIFLMRPLLLTGLTPLAGGNDGLMYEGYARGITQYVLHGEWLKALEGMSPVYYYMPGMRYFLSLQHFIFGDTHYGYVCFLVFFPLIIYSLLKFFLPPLWAKGLLVIFLFTPLFRGLGFSFFSYVKQTSANHSEPLGYGLFILGMCTLFRFLPNRKEYEWYGFWAHLSFAGAIFMRPNLALTIALFCGIIHFYLLSQKRYTDSLISSVGLLPVLLIPFHNWWFGGQLVLLTSAASIPENLTCSPTTYGKAFLDFCSGHAESSAFMHVKKQLFAWNKPINFYRILPLGVTLWVLLSRKFDSSLRILAVVAISLQCILFFYIPIGRYSFLAWMLPLIVFFSVIHRKVVPAWKNRRAPSRSRDAAKTTPVAKKAIR